jgi:ceramide glucosyltransferase
MDTLVDAFILLLVLASWVYTLGAWWLVRRFFRTLQPLARDFTPPVSILKPVKGLDFQAFENFASFCEQDYPDYELLFGVDEPGDPAVSVIRRLQRAYPERSIRLLVTPSFAANRKASTLHQLVAEARHDLLVVSDSDMRVTPGYLRRVVSPLAEPATGLVTCPYRGSHALTFTARLEALHMGVLFLPSTLVGRRVMTTGFAMGSTIALRQRDLERIGGFGAVAEYLADDYEVGARIKRAGLSVHLSDYVVVTVLGVTTFREQWQRELRWAYCNRVSRPWEYPGLLLTYTVPLALLFLVATGFAQGALAVLVVSLALRWVTGWYVTQHTGDFTSRRCLLWLPLRECLSAVIWCAGALTRRFVWRGESYELDDDGRMHPLGPRRRGWRDYRRHV